MSSSRYKTEAATRITTAGTLGARGLEGVRHEALGARCEGAECEVHDVRMQSARCETHDKRDLCGRLDEVCDGAHVTDASEASVMAWG